MSLTDPRADDLRERERAEREQYEIVRDDEAEAAYWETWEAWSCR